MNRGARVHFSRGIRHLCYSDLLPAIFIVFQKPIKIDPPAEVSRVARFFKPAQKGRRLEVREWIKSLPARHGKSLPSILKFVKLNNKIRKYQLNVAGSFQFLRLETLKGA